MPEAREPLVSDVSVVQDDNSSPGISSTQQEARKRLGAASGGHDSSNHSTPASVQVVNGDINNNNATTVLDGDSAKKASDPGIDSEGDMGSKLGICVTMCIAIPAFLGSWCWPVMVIGLMNVMLNTKVVDGKTQTHLMNGFEVFLFAMNLTVFSNFLQWMKKKGYRENMPNRYRGPLVMLAVATFLMVVDQIWAMLFFMKFDLARKIFPKLVKDPESGHWHATLTNSVLHNSNVGGTALACIAFAWFLLRSNPKQYEWLAHQGKILIKSTSTARASPSPPLAR